MTKTRQNIIDSAIKLFNEKGIVNVRLQTIANDVGISIGNLAYHFYSKKAIVIEIDSQLGEKLSPLLNKQNQIQYFIDFDNHLANYYYLLSAYSFYFLDILELQRAYPIIYSKRRKYMLKMIKRIHKWILINKSMGKLKKEVFEDQYLNTSKNIWLSITFWMTKEQVLNETRSEEAFKARLWTHVIPMFTKKGFMEYEAMILPNLIYKGEVQKSNTLYNYN